MELNFEESLTIALQDAYRTYFYHYMIDVSKKLFHFLNSNAINYTINGTDSLNNPYTIQCTIVDTNFQFTIEYRSYLTKYDIYHNVLTDSENSSKNSEFMLLWEEEWTQGAKITKGSLYDLEEIKEAILLLLKHFNKK